MLWARPGKGKAIANLIETIGFEGEVISLENK